jgi:predicted DNA-binding transcriptional regulator AlpA
MTVFADRKHDGKFLEIVCANDKCRTITEAIVDLGNVTREPDQEQGLGAGTGDETSLEGVSSRFDRDGVVSPEEREAALLADIKRYLEAHPDRGKAFIKAVKETVREAEREAEASARAESGLPPSTERTLNLRQASERIGITHPRVYQLYKDGRLGQEINGKPRFSELECDLFRESDRRPGPKPRSPENPA